MDARFQLVATGGLPDPVPAPEGWPGTTTGQPPWVLHSSADPAGTGGKCEPDASEYWHHPREQRVYEYKVVQVREGLIGGKMSGDKLEKILNEHASRGWQLKAITAVEVKGRIGPGGVEGVLVTFERPRG